MLADEIKTRNFTFVSDEYCSFFCAKHECRKCEMFDCYKRVVHSEGNASNPTFMFVGECPGRDEIEQIRPFIGRAGQRLRDELRKHKDVFNRQNSIMTNVLSCRPKDNTFPERISAPKMKFENLSKLAGQQTSKYYTTDEGDSADVALFCAQKWLFKEIELLQPKVIIPLGANPLRYVCGVDGIGEKRGEWIFVNRFRAWALPTFHPSYVLRCANDANRSYVPHYFEQDIAKVAETWSTMVSSDYRMRMNLEDWRRKSALEAVRGKMAGLK